MHLGLPQALPVHGFLGKLSRGTPVEANKGNGLGGHDVDAAHRAKAAKVLQQHVAQLLCGVVPRAAIVYVQRCHVPGGSGVFGWWWGEHKTRRLKCGQIRLDG